MFIICSYTVCDLKTLCEFGLCYYHNPHVVSKLVKGKEGKRVRWKVASVARKRGPFLHLVDG